MSKLEELIEELCPDGVEYKKLKEVAQISAGGDLPRNYAKGQKVATEQYPYPIYSNGTEGGALYGFTDSYKIEKEAVTVSARGTIGYHEVRAGKFTPIVRLITLIADESKITTKFLHYALYIAGIEGVTTGIPSLTVPMLGKFTIPIPPLPVQNEIVRILDNFTELTAELTAELIARKKQYEYYKDKLFLFDDSIPVVTTKDVSVERFWLMPATPKYISDGISYITSKNVRNGVIDFKDVKYISKEDYELISKNRCVQKNDLLITMIGTIGEAAFVDDFAEFYGQNLYLVRMDETKCMRKYFYYYLTSNIIKNSIISKKNASSQGYIKAGSIDDLSIPLPPLEEQQRIVAILDRFDTLCNDISTGLPAEIEARTKQYEYYRDKLLTFPERA